MESKLETLLKILRRAEPTTTVRKLKSEAETLLATTRATAEEVSELCERVAAEIGTRNVTL